MLTVIVDRVAWCAKLIKEIFSRSGVASAASCEQHEGSRADSAGGKTGANCTGRWTTRTEVSGRICEVAIYTSGAYHAQRSHTTDRARGTLDASNDGAARAKSSNSVVEDLVSIVTDTAITYERVGS